MKTFTIRWLALLCAGLLCACSPRGSSAPESESRRWEQQYQNERHLRQQAEVRSIEQQSARSRWQNVASLLAVAAVILLILGTILGSAARHESEQT